MPQRALKPCAHGGCHAVVRGGTYCPGHTKQHVRVRSRADRAKRGTARQQGYDSTWEKVRALHLVAHPFCAECRTHGWVVRAKDVDHIVPFDGTGDPLRLDPMNLRSLCRACHNRKTHRNGNGGAP